MGKIPSFKDEFTFDQRLEESRDIIAKYPNRVPVIVERYSKADLPEMEKKKYLVPRDMSVGQFIHILSLRLRLSPGKALFVFVKNTLPQTATLMDSLYESFKEDDGFLYMCYSSEKTFGCATNQITPSVSFVHYCKVPWFLSFSG
ncbi:hypothetical protein ERO13_A11G106500v2 [Gossypium hirsutum]|uniref:Autophagy-related protein n=5 Tax=Gossypium TaxID=3633 RepID=A0ABR0MZI9_GOSAR|nr:autophagy-related protein 8i [Gossypium hirsutum]XP_017629449.1 autophagy-related protein 8i-like [Gossypium arboreum]KAB2056614.1 hypothetical protein ES319_A11G114300v1 [Gossypium barbadense]TYG93589.1 hypothetical protein ES288_A11G122100v1 [Gossypium darwinii]TYJ09099.1 hypothetical protein E1A91_A11G117800v1 [Gossypium mustelinum]KAG4174215.1 hypothetical protein ERO13_A11G106500v2 [Gossypium hirsutum]KAK5783727.1 hypothetical protein PVK06_038240 [Gossypium arboreum]